MGKLPETPEKQTGGDQYNKRKRNLSNDEDEAVSGFRSFDDLVSASAASQRFDVILVGAFGSIALLLTAVGVFGVLSYLVTQQTHDIGIRLALGAQRWDVLALVMRRGVLLAGLGAVIGAVAALSATRLMASLFYGISPTDPLTFIGAVVVQIAVALAACYIPARHAMRVDPIEALRYE